MAAPRVFISSTYYDLKYVRNDIANFLDSLGYESVMHDRGGVAYTQSEPLEQSCYSELSTCEIIVCIIGNKYGTQSGSGDYSITMEELKTAIKAQKKIYIYIQKDVAIENRTYLANRENDSFKSVYADDIRIHAFISNIKENIKTHPIKEFDSVSDIIGDLKSQFAGMFQHLLRQESTLTESKTYYDLKTTSDHIELLIKDLKEEKNNFFARFDNTIYVNNILLTVIFRKLNINNGIIFVKTKDGLIEIFEALGFSETDNLLPENFIEYERTFSGKKQVIKISQEAFDDEDHIVVVKSTKKAESIVTFTEEDELPDDSDLPF